jgi:1-acyl-sn-glycerol-3-phosphate acyltransferase
MSKVHPKLEFIPQRFNYWVLWLVRWLIPILLRFRLRPWLPVGITQIEAVNAKTFVELFQKFQVGKIRLLIAFRHPQVDDPLCMFYLLSKMLPKVARQHQIRLQSLIHSHFIYDRGMTIWAGRWLGWLFSRLGGIPIHRGKRIDRTGMKAARQLLLNGKFPLSIAPEGATNGLSEVVSPLEPGVAQLGFWCLEDLIKADRPEDVVVVPVGIRYSYINPDWTKLDALFSQLEAEIGLPDLPLSEFSKLEESQMAWRYERLLRLAEQLISQMEHFYRQFYRQSLPENVVSDEISVSRNQVLTERLKVLLDVALRVSEQYFGLQAHGTFIDRCRRLEEASWNCIYREDISDLNSLTAVERGLADWAAEEADLRIRHMRLVESLVAVTGEYVKEEPTFDRFAETTLLLFDVMARVEGKKMPRRPRLGWRRAKLAVGEPISLRDRATADATNHKAARQAVMDLTQELQEGLEKLISGGSGF